MWLQLERVWENYRQEMERNGNFEGCRVEKVLYYGFL